MSVRRSPVRGRARPAASPVCVERLEGRQLLAASTAGWTPLRIETGTTAPYTDSRGQVWNADAGFVGGTAVPNSPYEVANTADDRLYSTRRWGNFSYARPVDNGTYAVLLHFADPLYTAAGHRKFDVAAEGNVVLSQFDVAANGGGKAATVKSVTVSVVDGRLDLKFTGIVENAIVSAVEILPINVNDPTAAPPAPANLVAAPATTAAGGVRLNWTDQSSSETGFKIERKISGGSYQQIGVTGSNVATYADANVVAGTTYVYRVRAANAVGTSGATNEATAAIPAGPSTPAPTAGWTPLFNGKDLSGFTPWFPSTGRSDPKGVFRAEDGMIHVLGLAPTSQPQEFGYLATNAEYSDYRLRLQYKWGTTKFAPRETAPRDSGVLLHTGGANRLWPRSLEIQIQEGDTGDAWLLGGATASTTVVSASANPRTYKPGGAAYTYRSTDSRLVKDGTYESLTDWNTLEVVVSGDDAVFVVNGRVVNRLTDLRQPDPADPTRKIPLTRGRIALQAEGAEVYYRSIEISPLAFAPPPAGATMLFNGGSTSQWRPRNVTGPISWPVVDRELRVNTAAGDIRTVGTYGDFRLHVEFNVPAKPAGTAEQDKGNSGIYLQQRYEVQILDSYGSVLSGKNDVGAIYNVKDATRNAALPAGAWQAYDITFRAARWSGTTKTENARVTVHLNGVLVQDDVPIPGPTLLGDSETPAAGPILLQDHDNLVRFRNIWIVPG